MDRSFLLPCDLVYECITHMYSLRDVFHWRMTCRHYRTLIDHLPAGYTRRLLLRRLADHGAGWVTDCKLDILFGAFLLQVVLGEEWPQSRIDVLVEPPFQVHTRWLRYNPFLDARLLVNNPVQWFYLEGGSAGDRIASLDFDLNRIYFDGTKLRFDGDWAALLRKEGKMWRISVGDYRAMFLGADGECACEPTLSAKSPYAYHSVHCNEHYQRLLRQNTAQRKQHYEDRGFFIDKPHYFRHPTYDPPARRRKKTYATDADGFVTQQ